MQLCLHSAPHPATTAIVDHYHRPKDIQTCAHKSTTATIFTASSTAACLRRPATSFNTHSAQIVHRVRRARAFLLVS